MEEEIIEIAIVPELLSEKSRALFAAMCETWNVKTATPTCYVFQNKACPTFTCTVTVIGRGETKCVSFNMTGHPNPRSIDAQNVSAFVEGVSVLAFIASL